VGIIVGAGIYELSPRIAGVGSAWNVLLIWLAGGLLSLMGACCYAELATRFPRDGGDVVYLTKAYGRWCGFLFGWVQLSIIRPGEIAAMSYIFAKYSSQLLVADSTVHVWLTPVLAMGSVALLTAVHAFGVQQGKWTQNILSLVQVAGVLMILGIALLASDTNVSSETTNNKQTVQTTEVTGESAQSTEATEKPQQTISVSLALIFVLFVFGGWSEIVYVAAEVKNPQTNIVYAILLGIVLVTLLYLLLNGAFMSVLGYSGLTTSKSVAADTVGRVIPKYAAGLINGLIAISALGSVSGLIFSGSRISYAVGEDHHLFALLHRCNRSRQTPMLALWLQASIAIVLILNFSFIEIIKGIAAFVYLFYLATALSVIVLRSKEPPTAGAFKVPGYPLTPMLFAGVCGLLIYSGLTNPEGKPVQAVCLLLSGIPLYFISEWLHSNRK